MEVDGEGVHGGDFRLHAAEHTGEGLAEGLGIGQPGIVGMEVTADGELLPVFEFLLDEAGGLAGLEAEGVAAEINGFAGRGVDGCGRGGIGGRGERWR